MKDGIVVKHIEMLLDILRRILVQINERSFMKRIFIIEDDMHLATNLRTVLEKNGYSAEFCKELDAWEKEFNHFQPDLLLLDINLQVTNGYVICTELRKKTRLPVIFITGRDCEEDEIRALNLGGDDYLRKPFSDALLLAYVARQLKVHSVFYRDAMRYRNLQLDIAKRLVLNDDTGDSIELTGMEFQIIFYLMGKAETVVSRGEITDYLWKNRCYVDENALNVNLSRLRSKLTKIECNQLLHSIKGEGLSLCFDNT